MRVIIGHIICAAAAGNRKLVQCEIQLADARKGFDVKSMTFSHEMTFVKRTDGWAILDGKGFILDIRRNLIAYLSNRELPNLVVIDGNEMQLREWVKTHSHDIARSCTMSTIASSYNEEMRHV